MPRLQYLSFVASFEKPPPEALRVNLHFTSFLEKPAEALDAAFSNVRTWAGRDLPFVSFEGAHLAVDGSMLALVAVSEEGVASTFCLAWHPKFAPLPLGKLASELKVERHFEVVEAFTDDGDREKVLATFEPHKLAPLPCGRGAWYGVNEDQTVVVFLMRHPPPNY